MSQEIAVPDYLKDMMDDGVNDASSIISSTDSVPRISLKGMRFRMIVGGEEISKTSEPLQLIILGVEPEKAMCKTYYIGGYEPDSSDPPDCSSSDGIVPDAWVSSPQNDKCATCPQNAWGSAKSMSGGKAKACRDSKRLMVVEAKNLKDEDSRPFILNVTVASLKSLSAYGKLLVENRIPMAAAITTVAFDDEADHPKLLFSLKGCLKEEMGKFALARSAKKEWKDFSQPAIAHEGAKTKQLTQDDDDDEPVKPKKKKAKFVEEDEDDKPTKKVKGELVENDDEDSNPVSDVDDLLDGWDD